ncbi:hypothetical protein M758_1G021600 [Ceratodon purpureus]|nr:hypothetical protein M758_1G021600 [Ceratodon purpureus]
MGIYLGKLFSGMWWGNKTYKILMTGLDSAGKTTILYQLKLGHQVETISTIGHNAETIEFGNLNLTVYDLGGWTNQPFWVHYLPGVAGLIFVVDLSDKERIHEARDKLHAVLSDDASHASLVVFANKQDKPGAMSIPEATAALELHKVERRKYFVQGSSARSGEGLLEGLEWLASAIRQEL